MIELLDWYIETLCSFNQSFLEQICCKLPFPFGQPGGDLVQCQAGAPEDRDYSTFLFSTSYGLIKLDIACDHAGVFFTYGNLR